MFDFYVFRSLYLVRTAYILQSHAVTHCMIFSYTSFTTYELIAHGMFSIPGSGNATCLFTVHNLIRFVYMLRILQWKGTAYSSGSTYICNNPACSLHPPGVVNACDTFPEGMDVRLLPTYKTNPLNRYFYVIRVRSVLPKW